MRSWCQRDFLRRIEFRYKKTRKRAKVIDLYLCRCQDAYKRAPQYGLVSSLDMHVVITGMNILLGRMTVHKFIECYGSVPSAKQRTPSSLLTLQRGGI